MWQKQGQEPQIRGKQMANKHVKKWAISVIKEMQFYTMVRNYYILFSLAEGKNIDHTKDVAHRNSETLLMRTHILELFWHYLIKLDIRTVFDPATLFPSMDPAEMQTMYTKIGIQDCSQQRCL